MISGSTVTFLGALALLCEFLLLMTALKITLTSSVASVIVTYRTQSLILAGVTGFTAWNKMSGVPNGELGLVAQAVILVLIMVLPLALGPLAKWLLIRATRRPKVKGIPGETKRDWRDREAERTWRDASELAVSTRAQDVIAFVGIIALSALVAARFHLDGDETISLTVSLTLHLVGLYIMAIKRDLISQTIGLLVMDHGLYLAVVKIVAVPVPALFFVVGLWFYTLVTVAILVLMVPEVRQKLPAGIDLARIARQSDLKG